MRPSTFVLKVFSLLSFLVLLAGEVVAQDPWPTYEPSECPFEGGDEVEGVECGYLIVPEHRDRPNGRTLRLAVAVVRSLSDAPAPDPLVFLDGGPGAPSVTFTPQRLNDPLWNAFRQKRDLVFMDQRGAGYSDPAFCPDMNAAIATVSLRGLSPEQGEALIVEAVQRCRQQMLQEGLDFSAYNSATIARDFDDLRRVLGYERWNLLGFSYGTRLALTALRDTPEGIRSAILASPLPPNVRLRVDGPSNFARSLRLVYDRCAADEACRRAFPTLEEDFYAALDSLERNPIVLAMPDTTRFPDGRIVVDGTLLAGGIFSGLYNRPFISVLPLAIREVKAQNIDVLRALSDGLAPHPNFFSMGLQYAIICYEVDPFNPPEMIEAERGRYPRLRTWGGPSEHTICEAWHDVRADSTEIQPVSSDIPTLILAGEFDPVTPPAYGRLAAETLSKSTFIEVPGYSHWFWANPQGACTRTLMASFLDDPALPPDTSCVAEIPPVRFADDVHLNGGIYRLGSQLQRGPSPLLLIGLGLIVLLLLSAVLAWPAGYLVRRLRHQPLETTGTQRGARWLAGIACVLALGFLSGLVAVIMRTAAENPFLLAFGVPGSVGWLFLVPWMVLVVTLGVVVLAVLAWRRRWWTLLARMHYVLVAAACLGFVLFASSWGLMSY